MKTMELYESPMLERNQEKYGNNDNQCVCCGKPMKKGKCFFVHMNTGWEAVSIDVTYENCKEETGFESQGWFPIGNDCAKKMKGFVIEGEI